MADAAAFDPTRSPAVLWAGRLKDVPIFWAHALAASAVAGAAFDAAAVAALSAALALCAVGAVAAWERAADGAAPARPAVGGLCAALAAIAAVATLDPAAALCAVAATAALHAAERAPEPRWDREALRGAGHGALYPMAALALGGDVTAFVIAAGLGVALWSRVERLSGRSDPSLADRRAAALGLLAAVGVAGAAAAGDAVAMGFLLLFVGWGVAAWCAAISGEAVAQGAARAAAGLALYAAVLLAGRGEVSLAFLAVAGFAAAMVLRRASDVARRAP